MAFEPKKFNDIFEDMRGRTTALTDFEVGSVTRTMLESFSFEMGLLYQKMNLVYLSGFVDTANGSHLDNVVAVLGIQRGLPDFAVGKVTFTRDKGNAEVTIPVGTLVATEEKPDVPKKVYATLEDILLVKDQQEATVPIQALERGQEQNADIDTVVVMPRPIAGIKSVTNTEGVKLIGRRRETDDELRRRAKNALLASGKANISALENAVLALSGVLDVKIIEEFRPNDAANDFGFGMVKVVVDASEYDKIRDTVFQTVERVRAAGVYADIQQAKKIKLDGTFRIDAAGQQNLTAEERVKFEQKVKEAIEDFLRSIKMGEPLSISKLMQAVLTVDGVDNLADYRLLATKPKPVGGGVDIVPIAENKIKAEPLERFSAGDLFVASEDKTLIINISFKGTAIDSNKITAVQTNLNPYFSGLAVGAVVDMNEIQTRLTAVVGAVSNLKISVRSWSKPNTEMVLTTNYTPLFVEKLKLGNLFGYNNLITIEAALLLTVSDVANAENIKLEVRKRMNAFLEALPPKTPVVLEDFLADIKKTAGVVEAIWSEDDFVIKKDDNIVVENGLANGKIDIKEFEKPALPELPSKFVIATTVLNIEVTFTNIAIKIRLPHTYSKAADEARVKAVITDSLKSFFATLTNGQDVKYLDLQDKVRNTDIGFNFRIETFDVSVAYPAGTQTANLLSIKNFNFKITERAVFKAATINVTAEVLIL